MPIVNKRLDDMPVIISTYEGMVKAQEIIEATEAIFKLSVDLYATGLYHGLFHIIDTIQAETTFADMIAVLKMNQTNTRLSEAWNLKIIFIGTHSMAKFYVNAASQEQFGGLQPLLFREMADALDYIHTEMSSWPQP